VERRKLGELLQPACDRIVDYGRLPELRASVDDSVRDGCDLGGRGLE